MPKQKLREFMIQKGGSYYYRPPRRRGAKERPIALGQVYDSACLEADRLNAIRTRLTVARVDEFAQQQWLPILIRSRRPDPRAQRLAAQRYRDYGSPILGSRLLGEVQQSDFDAVHLAMRAKGKHPQTIRHVLLDLGNLFKYAVRMGLIDVSPFREIQLPRVQRRLPRPFSDIELGRIFGEGGVPERYHPIMRAAMYTGMRYGELRSLAWSDFDLGDRPAVQVWKSHEEEQTKSGRARRVPLFQAAADLFRGLPRESSFVFTGRGGGMINQNPGVLDMRLKVVGKDGIFHRFRHTFATRFLRAGGSYEDLQSLLGHADLRTTMIYGLVEDTHVARRARELTIDWFGRLDAGIARRGELVGKASA